MNYSTNYNLNKPERSEQFNLDHWNNNTDTIDTQMHINKVNIAQNATDIATLFTGLNTKNTSDTNSVFYKLMKLIYPVGSLYWSANSTNPSTLFGGTWVQIKDKFILACGDTYKTVGATGGASSVTLSVDNMPSHDHSFTPSGTVSSHCHGLNNHTHNFTPSGTVSSTFTGSAVDTSSNGQHYHTFQVNNTQNRPGGYTTAYDSGSKVFDQSTTSDGEHTHSVTAKGTVSSSFTGTAGTTGGNSGNTTSVQPTFTGTAGTTGSNGSGTAFSILPPYVVKYCWERTA